MINFYFNIMNITLIYTKLELFSYSLQQSVCNMINLNSSSNEILTFIFIFIAGLITVLNPCFISILPISISYLNIIDLKNRHSINKNFFIIGICSSFVAVIFITHIISYRYNLILSNIPILSSVSLIFLGLNFLQIIELPTYLPFSFNKVQLNMFSNNLAQAYIIGFFCNFTTLPCSTPIILTILFWLSHANSLLLSVIYLLIYLSGSFISIFILITSIYNSMNTLFFIKVWNTLFPLSGLIILFNGTLSLLSKIYS